jgi:hypothetical protein
MALTSPLQDQVSSALARNKAVDGVDRAAALKLLQQLMGENKQDPAVDEAIRTVEKAFAVPADAFRERGPGLSPDKLSSYAPPHAAKAASAEDGERPRTSISIPSSSAFASTAAATPASAPAPVPAAAHRPATSGKRHLGWANEGGGEGDEL